MIPSATGTKVSTTWTPFVSSKHWVCKWDHLTSVRCGKSLLEIQLWRRSSDSREKVGQRKKTTMTQQINSAKPPTHIVFVMFVYCMEPEWWLRPSYVGKCSIFCTNAIWHPTDEIAGKDGCLLSEHRFQHSQSMPAMSNLPRASVRTIESCRPPHECYLRSRGATYCT